MALISKEKEEVAEETYRTMREFRLLHQTPSP